MLFFEVILIIATINTLHYFLKNWWARNVRNGVKYTRIVSVLIKIKRVFFFNRGHWASQGKWYLNVFLVAIIQDTIVLSLLLLSFRQHILQGSCPLIHWEVRIIPWLGCKEEWSQSHVQGMLKKGKLTLLDSTKASQFCKGNIWNAVFHLSLSKVFKS